jgi:prepilin-type N-terminal cleavage/methylation domain-containing protein
MRATKTKKQPRTFCNQERSEKGFTLIETSIAMVITMVAALGAATLFTYSIGYNSGGNDRAAAISIAQQQIEQLRSVPFSDPLLNTTGPSGTVLTPDFVNNGRSYRITKTVTGSNDVDGLPRLKTITIRVAPLSQGFVGFPIISQTTRSSTARGPFLQ